MVPIILATLEAQGNEGRIIIPVLHGVHEFARFSFEDLRLRVDSVRKCAELCVTEDMLCGGLCIVSVMLNNIL